MGGLDLITSIDLIGAVELSPYYGNYEFLKKALGEETATKMHILGYYTTGFYINTSEKKIVQTYKTTERYRITRDSIKKQRRSLLRIFY
jgi:hypothetical protein